jgi:hypothetical protein
MPADPTPGRIDDLTPLAPQDDLLVDESIKRTEEVVC